MGDNTEMGTPAVTEELHAKRQEAARKEAERAVRKAPQDAAGDAKGEAGEPASKKFLQVDPQPAAECRAQAERPGDGTRWDTGMRRPQPVAQAGAAHIEPAGAPNSSWASRRGPASLLVPVAARPAVPNRPQLHPFPALYKAF
jgi:hypothetical protein